MRENKKKERRGRTEKGKLKKRNRRKMVGEDRRDPLLRAALQDPACLRIWFNFPLKHGFHFPLC